MSVLYVILEVYESPNDLGILNEYMYIIHTSYSLINSRGRRRNGEKRGREEGGRKEGGKGRWPNEFQNRMGKLILVMVKKNNQKHFIN